MSDHGADVAKHFIEMFRSAIATLFKDIDKNEEEELINAFKSVNEILMKMELKNA